MKNQLFSSLPRDARDRYPCIDVLRGLAVATMLAANLAAGSLAPPHPFAFRAFGSFAAPAFIFLVGLMVAAHSRGRPLGRFVRRGVSIVLVGVAVDVLIWNIVPFTTWDVLYLIGLAVPLTAAFCRLPAGVRPAVCLVPFAAEVVVRKMLNYNAVVQDVPLPECLHHTAGDYALWAVRSMAFDGWFPVVPWLGFALLGAVVADHGGLLLRHRLPTAAVGAVLASAGLAWLRVHPPLSDREGYTELFYPPGVPYIAAAIGVLMLAVVALPALAPSARLRPRRLPSVLDLPRVLGAHSLLVYVLHAAAIRFVIGPAGWTSLSLGRFAALWAGLTITMVVAALIADRAAAGEAHVQTGRAQ